MDKQKAMIIAIMDAKKKMPMERLLGNGKREPPKGTKKDIPSPFDMKTGVDVGKGKKMIPPVVKAKKGKQTKKSATKK